MSALDSRYAIDRDDDARRKSVTLLMHLLDPYLAQSVRRDVMDTLFKAFEQNGTELTSAAMRKEYEAWKRITLDTLPGMVFPQ